MPENSKDICFSEEEKEMLDRVIVKIRPFERKTTGRFNTCRSAVYRNETKKKFRMSSPSIEEQILIVMLDFIFHPSFEREAAKLKRRFSLDQGLQSFQRLCEVQFNPISPQQVIAPAKLHRVTQNDLWSAWKIELVVPGLRPNQFPRVWFAVKGSNIAFYA